MTSGSATSNLARLKSSKPRRKPWSWDLIISSSLECINPVNWHQLTSKDMVSQCFSSEWYHDIRGISAYHQLHQLRMSMIFAQVFWRISEKVSPIISDPWIFHGFSMIFHGFSHGFSQVHRSLEAGDGQKSCERGRAATTSGWRAARAAERGWRNAMELAIYMLVYCNMYIWVCLKIGYIPNYSHLIGIMIINHWV